MKQEFASMRLPSLSAQALKASTKLLPNLRVPMVNSPQGMPPILRSESVVPFAVRNELRSPAIIPALAYLQKCAGMAFVAAAWLVFLGGFAYLILAAVHNQQGELGLGLDATLFGAKSCLGSFLLAAVGVPQWVMGARKLQRQQAA